MSSTTVLLTGKELSFTCHSGLLAGEGKANSLRGIGECLEASVFRIEIDIHSMADGEYLVSHASRLEEDTTSRGPVGWLTSSVALGLRMLSGLGGRPPLLSEVVELARPYDSELQLDLKDWRPLTPERVEALAALLRPLGARAIVSTGQDWNLRAVARRAPGLRLGFDPDRYLAHGGARSQLPGRLGAYGYRDDHPLAIGRAQSLEEYLRERFDILLAQCPSVCELFIERRLLLQAEAEGVLIPQLLHERGVAVTAWTLDYRGGGSLGELKKLASAGVDHVTTNTARQFMAALA